MSSSSYFWANLGILQKVGVWSPYYEERKSFSTGKCIYDIYRTIIIGFCSIHTFTECFLICYDLKSLMLDELSVSMAYGIQHFLGIVKVYIIISQQTAILELDNRTKQQPLFRHDDNNFQKALRKTVNLSDKIGYIYWFFVLLTTSFALMTGIYVTINNKRDMDTICSKTLQQYDEYFIENKLMYPMYDNTVEMYRRVDALKNELKILNISVEISNDMSSINGIKCGKPKRVFSYHAWFPFNARQSPIYQIVFVLNFLGGLGLVICILPIDLLVMSYMRYIQFQFEVIKKDLINLREDSKTELQLQVKGDLNESHEGLLADVIIKRVRKIMHHQLAVYDFFDKTNDLFTWVLFAQYLGSAVMICGVLYTITSVMGDMTSPKFFHVAFFYSGLLFQLYSNCYYGSQVLILSSCLAEFTYFSGWQESGKYSMKIKPYILMIMNRSIRPCKLTAGKFAGVDLPTFLAVFKASYTYYTVLVDDGKRR